jgi:hypothetical protein
MIRLDELIKVESNWRRDWPKSGEFPKFLIFIENTKQQYVAYSKAIEVDSMIYGLLD